MVVLQRLEEIKERIKDESYKISSSQAYEGLRKAVESLDRLSDMRVNGQVHAELNVIVHRLHDTLVRGD